MACTPIKEVTCNTPAQQSPNIQSKLFIEVTCEVLRMLDPNDDQLIEKLNNELSHCNLKDSERVRNRIKNEIYRCTSEYRKLKSGNKRSAYNKKTKKIALNVEEIVSRSDLNLTELPQFRHLSISQPR